MGRMALALAQGEGREDRKGGWELREEAAAHCCL